MPFGFDFSGLFSIHGELTITRSIIGIVNWQVREGGLQGWAIRSMNAVRTRYGLASNSEAWALMQEVQENIVQAQLLNEMGPEADVFEQGFPHSSNVFGGVDSSEPYVVSGHAELVDEFGDVVRRVPFVIEGDSFESLQDLWNEIGESLHGFIDKYEEELSDDLGGGSLSVGAVKFNFVASRN